MTEENQQTYKTYIIPFDAAKGFPQSVRLNIYKWVLDFSWSYNLISKQPVLTVRSTKGNVLSINQLTPYNALYTHDNITGEPLMTIITADVSLKKISAFVAINRTWSGTALNEKVDHNIGWTGLKP